MQLNPGEQSILAYFPSSTKAMDAAEALKAVGISEVQVDRISRYGVTNDRKINNPVQGQADTQTGITLFSADTDQYANNDARILMGADPSVSGMAAHNYGVAGGKAFLVTVVTTTDRLDQAVKLLKDKNAYF